MAVGMNDLFEYAVIWMDLPKITFKYNKKQKKKKKFPFLEITKTGRSSLCFWKLGQWLLSRDSDWKGPEMDFKGWKYTLS